MDCFGRFTYEGRLVVGGAWIDGKGWLGGEGVAMVRTFSNVRELFFFFFVKIWWGSGSQSGWITKFLL